MMVSSPPPMPLAPPRPMQQRVLFSPASLLLFVAAIIISFHAGYSRSSIIDSLGLEKSTKDCRVYQQQREDLIDTEVKRRVEEGIIKISGGSSGGGRQHPKLNNDRQQQQHPSFITCIKTEIHVHF